MAVAALAAMSYWLGIWELVFSPRGAVFGAGHTDMTAQIPAQWILLVATLVLGVLVLLALVKRRLRFAGYGIGSGSFWDSWWPRDSVRWCSGSGGAKRAGIETRTSVQNRPPRARHSASHALSKRDYAATLCPRPTTSPNPKLSIRNVRLWGPQPLLETYNRSRPSDILRFSGCRH
jgi:hypothetical protein